MFWKSILKSLIKLETFCNRSVLIRGLEVEEIIPFPDWINPLSVLKTNFELLEKNEGHFVKDVLLSQSILVSLTLSPSILGHLWLSKAILDFLGSSGSISVYLILFMLIFSYHWLFQTTSSYNELSRLSLAIPGHLWLSWAISGYLSQVSSMKINFEILVKMKNIL